MKKKQPSLNLPVLSSKKIREVLESPTQISYPTKLTKLSLTESLKTSISTRSPKAFLPFLTERDSSGKILPIQSETPIPSMTPTSRKPISKNLSDKDFRLKFDRLQASPKTYPKKYRLISPRESLQPSVGMYSPKSSFGNKPIGFYSPRSKKLPEIAREPSPCSPIDTSVAYNFTDKHNLIPNLKKTTGRGKLFFPPERFDVSEIYNTKIPDNPYMIQAALADIDVNEYMHEISSLERQIQEQFEDIKKSHKKLLQLY